MVEVGSSLANSKNKFISPGYTCPKEITKNNWIGGFQYDDQFSVKQSKGYGGTLITVTRIDKSIAWGMDLRFECCRSGRFYINFCQLVSIL